MMKLRKVLCTALAFGMIVSTVPASVYAAEDNNTSNNSAERLTEFALENRNGYMGTVGKDDFKKISPELAKSIKASQENDIMSIAEDGGDKYEPNNNPSMATTGMKGQLVSANIHNENDVDWYELEVTSNDVANAVLYSFVLTNIPQNCDYDMYLVNEDLSGMMYNIQDGPVSEEMVFAFAEAGTYYVVIQSYSGYTPTYNYKLYFGPTYVNNSTNWRSTGLSFPFPNKAAGTDGYIQTTAGWLDYDLTNDASIPDLSIVTEFQMDSNHTGTWGGMYKHLKTEDYDIEFQQLGLINVMNVPEGYFYVKQKWSITGYVNYSTALIWNPNVLIKYKYPVIIENMGYLS